MKPSMSEIVASFYEERPYPPVSLLSPLLMGVRRDDLPLLNYQAGFAACFGSMEGSAKSPKILIAGSGTVEGVAVALANPGAEILAVDLSKKALKKLAWMAKCKGLKIETRVQDLQTVTGTFDYIIATGVLHHLEDPVRGLQHLKTLSHSHTVHRYMVYSKFGRELLYRCKDLASKLGIKDPKGMRKLIQSLPDQHPYKIYFHLYSDSSTDAGLADGYLHPCDQPFDALALREFLNSAGLDVRRFLHRPEGQPEKFVDFPNLGHWEKLALLELYGDLEENFCFFAANKESTLRLHSNIFDWNPALPNKGEFQSRLLGEKIFFQKSDLMFLKKEERRKLIDALFLLPTRNL